MIFFVWYLHERICGRPVGLFDFELDILSEFCIGHLVKLIEIARCVKSCEPFVDAETELVEHLVLFCQIRNDGIVREGDRADRVFLNVARNFKELRRYVW